MNFTSQAGSPSPCPASGAPPGGGAPHPASDPTIDEALRQLESLRDQHPFWNNRLFRACRAATLSAEDFRYFFSQYYLYSKNFTRYLCAFMASCEDDVLRARLSHNLADESGGTALDKSHAQIFRKFLTEGLSIDINKIEFQAPAKLFFREFLDYCMRSHCAASSAFLCLGTESIVSRMYSTFVDGMVAAGIKEEHLLFFRIHIASDDDHAATLLDIMKSYSHMPDWFNTCLQSMNTALNLRLEFFESIFDAIQYRRVQRTIESIQTRKSLVEETEGSEGFHGFRHDTNEPAPSLYHNQVERLNIDFQVERIHFKCDVLDPRIVRIPAGKFNEKHKHAHETVFYYLAGSGQVLVDELVVQVKKGDIVFVPRWALHQSQNLGAEEMVILAITDYGLTGRAFMGNYYRATRMADDPFLKFSTIEHVDREFWADPYPVFRKAREESPVYYSETFDAWFLTRYADVVSALRDPRLSSRRTGCKFQGLPDDLREAIRPFERSMGQWMIFNDPPDHTRLREPVNKAFTPRMVDAMRPQIERIVNELLDAVEGRGEMDVMRDFASPLPGIIVAEMLGVSGKDRRRFERWSDDIALFAGASQATRELAEPALRSWRDMTACVKAAADERRKNPREDLLTALIMPGDRGASFTEEEFLSTCVVLLAAGHGATQDTVCNSLLTILRHPEAQRAVQEDPALLAATGMDELLRYESALQLASRIALQDLSIGGKQIRKGQRVMGMLGAANRDPEQFSDPDRLDLHRQDNRHLAFGYGVHFCIGGPLGRVETEIAIKTMLSRLPKLKLATDKLEWKTSISFRGVRSLPVTF